MEKLPGSKDVTECPICLDIFNNPISTPCGHNFCLHCIENVVKQRFYRVKCPICRSFIPKSGYKINKLLDDLLTVIYPSEYIREKIDNILNSNRMYTRKRLKNAARVFFIIMLVIGLLIIKRKIPMKILGYMGYVVSKLTSLLTTVIFGQYAVFGHMVLSNFIKVGFRSSIVF